MILNCTPLYVDMLPQSTPILLHVEGLLLKIEVTSTVFSHNQFTSMSSRVMGLFSNIL